MRLFRISTTAGRHGDGIAWMVCVERTLPVPMAISNVRIERVLCAVTFSPRSRRVVAWAASLAEPNQGEVRLFHALPDSQGGASATSGADSERVLRKLFGLAQHLPGRPRISAAVTAGDAPAEILRHARLVKADLIAVGMHAQDGSVSPLAARLAVEAPCPVLVVDGTPTPPVGRGALDHILVAVNFLPASLAAADYAFALASPIGAQVTVVHVLPEHWSAPPGPDASVDEARQMVEHHFRRLLQIAVSEMSRFRRDRSELVTSGWPCVEIVRLASSRDADLIVMGIDASGESKVEFGETTNCVMQFARRPVLLVPARLFGAPRAGRRDRT